MCWIRPFSYSSLCLTLQLRNLVWSTSKHDVYLMSHYSIIHWSSLSSKKTEVLNVYGHVAPCEKHPESLLEGFTQTQVSTLTVPNNLLIAGGFQGELICKFLRIVVDEARILGLQLRKKSSEEENDQLTKNEESRHGKTLRIDEMMSL
ncbi:unnamed protein product [Fraxinus pennsylvanica]|uniref:Uncharacterized protein n=1 Tax=Fraxinus pennsylvanica TaxID=56036 RepID=A0AAD2DNK6_9LAMI|nr:unnamed protein product [Fraxinus pennsylvanica]